MQALDMGSELLLTYGYIAILLFVAIESMGIPVPGETMLLTAAIYAGVTHELSIVLIVVTAATGAILGDNLGYLAGRVGGYRLLHRWGHLLRLNTRRLTLGEYLFQRHGGPVVFCGRFIALLRIWAAFLAGAHRMPWRPFLLWNAAGGVIWAAVVGVGGYALGHTMQQIQGPIGIATAALALIAIGAGIVYLHRNEQRLADRAERAMRERTQVATSA
jgi:membrane protein DedA with SNARE-associated domain